MSCSSQLELLAHYVVCGHQENRTLLSLLGREKRQPWYMRAQMLVCVCWSLTSAYRVLHRVSLRYSNTDLADFNKIRPLKDSWCYSWSSRGRWFSSYCSRFIGLTTSHTPLGHGTPIISVKILHEIGACQANVINMFVVSLHFLNSIYKYVLQLKYTNNFP